MWAIASIKSEYHSTKRDMLTFIRDLFIATFSQMASLFGGIFIFGLLIHLISYLTFKTIEKAFRSKGTYIFAWFGTPIHELGHALFCLIFMHKIVKIELFRPGPVTGTLGYVSHKWNHSNPYQVLGNLFICTGPIAIGSFILYALFYFLIPNSSQALNSILAGVNGIDSNSAAGNYPSLLISSVLTIVSTIFNPSNLDDWKFWIFCYLSICISSNIRLSVADIKGSLTGFGLLILLFLLINFVWLLIDPGSIKTFPTVASSFSIVYSILILALIMSLIGFILIYFISMVYVRIRHGYFLNPF